MSAIIFLSNSLGQQTNYLHKKNKSTSHKQDSLGLIFFGNPKKSHTDQVYCKLFYSVWKETTPKPWTVATAKIFFSIVYVVVTNCFDKCFLFYVKNGMHCFLLKFIDTLEVSSSTMFFCSLKQEIWKKSEF